MNPFEVILIQPFLNILLLFYFVLNFLHIPWALAFSIILLTTSIRLLVWPLTAAQLKSTQKMAALKPHLDRIKAEHGHDKVRHNQEVTKLYKEHGVNPLAGCLPLLLQIPIFIALYNVLLKGVNLKSTEALAAINSKLYFPTLHLTKLPDISFFGLNLASKPNEWQHIGVFVLLVPILTGLFQLIQSKMLTPQQTPQNKVAKKEDEKESMEDTMAQMQGQMTLIMPLMIAFFSYNFPIGLALYWNTFTIIGIVQQYHIMGAGSLNKYLPQKWQKQS